ncbi:type VII secretion protein EccCa [Saccharopolyspora erythraea]|uniref:type VII secretion protein EccCa n=1 Tax=Saccharopolyspora erythraea TaxID=1836 RepID=UPI001BAD6B7C|nr:type VII secretion protein EccCa [Saccharopolyspora erythraea]QUG99929.1 type VII secretion protein EccCa [Saccharopolyspora erythraea]
MTTRLVHRPARTVRPLGGEDPLDIDPPPLLPEGKTAAGVQGLLPMAGAAASMTMMMFFRGSGFAALGAVVMLVSVCAAALFYFTQRGQATRKRRQQRERYLDHLEQLRDDLRDWEQDFQRRASVPDPPVGRLLDLVHDPARLWERRRGDTDFLLVRVGTGHQPVRELRMRVEGTPVNPPDPFMLAEANALRRRFGTVPHLPLRVNLDRAGDVSLIGEGRDEVLGAARTLIAQVAAMHAPDDVMIAVITPPEREADWAWVRWLPHAMDRAHIGPGGPQPLFAPDAPALAALLADDLTDRATRAAQAFRHGSGAGEAVTRSRLLVIDDAFGDVARKLPTPDKGVGLDRLGVTVLHLLSNRLHEPSEISSRVTVGEQVTVEQTEPRALRAGTLEPASHAFATGLARELAPLRLSADSYDDGSGTPPADFLQLLGIDDPAKLDVERMWARRGERDFLRVPIGVTGLGNATLLDLKESAQLGMGPHGLCVGATGSGKSELLRTLVLALVATHSPRQLSLVLVDYKGGATFAPFERLPHTAGLITNLESDSSLVERMYASLDGEVQRRQQLLADADKSVDITQYAMRRAALGEPEELPPLQHLFVVIDEFGELMTAKPEFIELFLRIGRIGRSIGVHLLLSSQRIEGGKLRGLDTYLSYRLGLRTLSEMESRTVLDTPDAFHLPPLPGAGYLKVDTSVYDQFKSAYVSGPVAEPEEARPVETGTPPVLAMPRYGSPDEQEQTDQPKATRRTTGPTLLSTIVEQLEGAAEPVAPVWLEPLPSAVTLDQAAGGFDVTVDGLRLRETGAVGLPVPMGRLDDPARQWQGTWTLDLSVAGGNLLVLGGPGAGKTTALRTLALGLACAHRPTDVGIYGIDLLGSGMRALADLPHVGGVAGRDDRERIRRTVDELHGMLAERERLFQRRQVDDIAQLRGKPAELPCTEVVLLIDGYGQLAGEFEAIEERVHDLLARGGRYGIHVVATARRWNEVRGAQQVGFGNRIELRLTDPAESSIDGKLARAVGAKQLGRALTTDRLFAQVALPRLDSVPDPAGSGLPEAAALVRSTWTGPVPPPIRVLPAVLDPRELPATDRGTVALGRFENDFDAANLDLFGRDQHLLVLGDTGTGKTNLLKLVTSTLVGQYSAEEIVFAVFDPRHGLEGLVPEDHLGGYASNHALANQLAQAVSQELVKRGSPDHPARPRIVLVIDDYDVLAASGSQPLAPFAPFLASGRDLGLHVVMTRRVMGAARGLFEPFTMGVRESGCLSLLMSGDRSEGQLFPGVRPTTLPPGRALLVRPGDRTRTVQTAFVDDLEDS